MAQYSAEQFRQKLAGLESPEKKFTEGEMYEMQQMGAKLVMALRDVFGHTLDRTTLWVRISNGMPIAASKSGGKGDKFIAALLDYMKAEANTVVTSDLLKEVNAKVLALTPEAQRQFIRICVEYRMLLCLEAREGVMAQRRVEQEIKSQMGADRAIVMPDGSIATSGEVQDYD